MTEPLLTPPEQQVLDYLGNAWNKFLKLPTLHPSDSQEMQTAIHAAQNIILARPVLRQNKEGNQHGTDTTAPA